MTPQESRAAKKTSAVMRAARKGLGLTQVFVSRKLGISQSALSKMESGYLIPSAPQWFEFCELTKIAPESLTTGYIDRNTLAVLKEKVAENGLKVPRQYTENAGSKVRAMLPILNYARATLGEEKLAEYFKSIKMDPDFFVDLDNQISLTFFLDLSKYLISNGHLTDKDFPALAGFVSDPSTHGNLGRHYAGEQDWTKLVRTLVSNAKYYECNFKYSIDEVSSDSITLSVSPEEHLKAIPYWHDADLGEFLFRFKKYYFEYFTGFGTGRKAATVTERDRILNESGPRCVYEIRRAS